MLTFISFILTIAVLIFVHEYGHYYVARRFKVKMDEFAIGFGPKIYSRTDKEGVRWQLRLIPLGGLVKMAEDDASSAFVRGVDAKKENIFSAQPAYVRFLIVAAGPIANYLLAILILSVFYFAVGKVELPAIVDKLTENSPAADAGLQIGDKIIKANGRKIRDFADLQRQVIVSANHPIILTLQRDQEILELSVTPTEREINNGKQKMKAGYLGINVAGEFKVSSLNLFASFWHAILDVIDLSTLTLKAVGQMLKGQRSIGELYGPLTVAEESSKAIVKGTVDFALFIAMLSVSLGLFNFFPIPLLDGGHLCLIGFEMVMGRAVSIRVQQLLQKIGVALIVFLVVISTSNDIRTLIF